MNKLNHIYETYDPLTHIGLSIFGEVADFDSNSREAPVEE